MLTRDKNTLRIDKVIAMSLVYYFLGHSTIDEDICNLDLVRRCNTGQTIRTTTARLLSADNVVESSIATNY